jgi:subtilase family serine protease
VTSVGGTSLAVNSSNQRSFETGWGTSKWALSGTSWVNTVPFLYGAGGGYTELDGVATFDRPSYQDGVVPSNTVGRAVPDISADADPTTGMLVGETQNFTLPSRFGPAGVHYGEYRIGGTSLASPLIAGMQAVAQGHSRIGFANPLIYSLARSGVYYDVTPQGDAGNVRSDFANGQNADDGLAYSVRTFDQDSSLTTGPGWDDVSGVGSPTAAYFGVFQNKFH